MSAQVVAVVVETLRHPARLFLVAVVEALVAVTKCASSQAILGRRKLMSLVQVAVVVPQELARAVLTGLLVAIRLSAERPLRSKPLTVVVVVVAALPLPPGALRAVPVWRELVVTRREARMESLVLMEVLLEPLDRLVLAAQVERRRVVQGRRALVLVDHSCPQEGEVLPVARQEPQPIATAALVVRLYLLFQGAVLVKPLVL